MNKIQELIKKLCPNGVEWKTLGEVISFLRTGLNPRVHFKLNTPDAKGYYVTVRELKGRHIEVDDKTDRINEFAVKRINERSNLQKGDILFSGTGTIGRTALVDEEPNDWNIKEGVYAITPNFNKVESLYLLYILGSENVITQIDNKSGGSTVRSIPMAELKDIQIPVPPLPIQTEIVNILDKFVEQQEQLEKLIELRKKQYEWYREEMLRAKEGWETKTLGECCRILKGKYITQKDSKPGPYPVVLGGQEPAYYIDEFNHSGEVIAVSRSGVSAGFISYWNQDIFVSDGFMLEPKECSYRFLYLFLKSKQDFINSLKRGAGIPHITTEHLKEIKIPILSKEKDYEIVNALDSFESSISALTSALELSKKRYEYYRDEMLRF